MGSYYDTTILIIDPAHNNAEITVQASASRTWAFALDNTSGVVYASGTAPCSTCASSVTVIDPNTNNVRYITVGRENVSLVVNPKNGKVYVPNAMDNTLSIIDPASNYAVTTIPVGNFPSGTAVDGNGNVYVSNTFGKTVSVINPFNNNSIATISITFSPCNMAYDSGTNTVVVGNYGSNGTVSVISAASSLVSYVNGVTGTQDYVVTNSSRGESYIVGQGSQVAILVD